ncbi:ATP-binding protein [Falsiroseomonas sp.]|uniref:ATP-binding protein n=1 Tax=Falsiroseomonas sp. TaxID=2870721 RepID=UPI003F70B708
MLRLEVPIRLPAIAEAQAAIEAWAGEAGLGPAATYRLALVAEELLANLVMHGRFAGEAPAARLSVEAEGGAAVLVIEDAAAPFDPRAAVRPAAPRLDDDRIGGMGLALVRKMAAGLDYGPAGDGWNRTRITLDAA